MRVRITLEDAGGARDLEVSGPPGTTVSDVLSAAAVAGQPSTAPRWVHADGRRVPLETRLGEPGLRDGCRLVVDRPAPAAGPAALAELRVLAGPDAGTRRPLRRGAHRIGRSGAAELVLSDPLCSWWHAEVRAGADGSTTLADTGSANGTRLDGRRLPDATPTALGEGHTFRIGDTELGVRPTALPRAAVSAAGDGGLAIVRTPRHGSVTGQVVVEWPKPPEPRGTPRLALLAMAAPVVAGVGLAVLLRAPQFLLLTALTPIVLLGTWWSERRWRRRGGRQDVLDHHRAVTVAAAARDAALHRDQRRARVAHPDLAELSAQAQGPGRRLWERRRGDPDYAVLRLGSGSAPTGVTITRTDAAEHRLWAAHRPHLLALATVGIAGLTGPPEPLCGLARSLVVQLAVLHSPQELSILVLGGPTGGWRWARWLPHLRPCPALPDLALAAAARVTRRAALAQGIRSDPPPPDTVLLVPDAARLGPEAADLLPALRAAGMLVLCLAHETRRLPGSCAAVVTASGDVGSRGRLVGGAVDPTSAGGTRGGGGEHDTQEFGFVLDLLSVEVAEQVARWLAPLRDPGGDDDRPPTAVRLLDLMGWPDPAGTDTARSDAPRSDAARVAEAWSRYDGRPRVLLGRDGRGPLFLDLARDGPHALVAGTTGAGKSQLLQTMVAALAAGAGPADLQFVLIDYKGGAAFRECAELPHTVGLVTDLDAHTTRRALRSLTAELTRRERVLAAAGVSDLDAYRAWSPTAASRDRCVVPDASASGSPATGLTRRAPTGEWPRLSRLVIVVDEFAALAAELPDFVSGLVAVAARGRSLGLHLVLATQRPGGSVTPEMRANCALRIALRVTDDGESRDIVDQAGAAAISRHTPGRALVRTGREPAVEVQTAWVAGSPRAEPDGVLVRPWDGRPGRPEPAAGPAPADTGPTAPAGHVQARLPSDLQRLVAACRTAASTAGKAAPVVRPWLPTLPDAIGVAALPPAVGAGGPTGAEGGPEPPLQLGVIDRPDQQDRIVLTHDLAAAGLLVVGGARSGRTTLLRTLVAAAVSASSGRSRHLHVIDCAGGALATALAPLPQLGTVVRDEDTARGARLLTLLLAELDRRRRNQAASHLPPATHDPARDGSRTGAPAPPSTVLLVDGWEGFVARYEPVDGGRPVDDLLRLAREGPAAGLPVVLTSDRAGLGLRLASVFPVRIVLPLTERADYSLASIPARDVPVRLPPGRALLDGAGGPALEAQIAVVGGDPEPTAQNAALAAAAGAGVDGGDVDGRGGGVGDGSDGRSPRRRRSSIHPNGGVTPAPLRLAVLPTRVTRADLPPTTARRPWLGVAGDLATPLALDLDRCGPAVLIAGPPRSGRTTTLRSLLAGLSTPTDAARDDHPGPEVALIARRQSALSRDPGPALRMTPDDPPDALLRLAGTGVAAAAPFGGDPSTAGPTDRPQPGPEEADDPRVSLVVLVDDIEELLDTPLEAALLGVLRTGRAVVVGAARTEDLAGAFRGVAAQLRRRRCGLLLGPAPGDGDLLGVRLPRESPERRPGRGWWIADGGAVRLQVAVPP